MPVHFILGQDEQHTDRKHCWSLTTNAFQVPGDYLGNAFDSAKTIINAWLKLIVFSLQLQVAVPPCIYLSVLVA